MRFGVNRMKSSFLLLLFVAFVFTACSQSEQSKIEQSRRFEKQALELRLKKDFRGALREQSKAVELNEDAQGLTILAGIYQEINETENVPEYLQKSKEVLEKAVKLDPKDAVARDMFSAVLDQTGDERGALRERLEAAKLKPANLMYLTNVGVSQDSLGDTASAEATFQSVLQKNPDYIYALLHYGLLEVDKGNLDKARRLFIRAMEAPQNEELDASFAERAKNELRKMDGVIK